MGERPEGCITHNAPLILCDQCVHENGMRVRRRLFRAIGEVVRKHAKPSPASWNRLLADIEAELLKELPE